jgi:hypothetical protein
LARALSARPDGEGEVGRLSFVGQSGAPVEKNPCIEKRCSNDALRYSRRLLMRQAAR